MKTLITVIFIIILGGITYLGIHYSRSSTDLNNITSVDIAQMAYHPDSISIKKGTEVTFNNNDTMAHTVTADDGSFDSGPIIPGGHYKHTFNNAGAYSYHCSIHPYMKGKVAVQ